MLKLHIAFSIFFLVMGLGATVVADTDVLTGDGFYSGKYTIPTANGLYRVVSETVRVVTAYNAGDPNQTDATPCIDASGENICQALARGRKHCAANFVPLGTYLHIEKFGSCHVTDRTNARYKNRVDIAMLRNELSKARQFGRQKLQVSILEPLSNHTHHPYSH
jgi:3D (Asp-Asp-Asp) domain-containing protein